MSNAPLSLARRERQIMEVLYRLGEASVAQVLDELTDPPTYSAVRGMLNVLGDKKLVVFRQDGKRYLYRPAKPKDRVRRSVLQNLVSNFFGGQPADVVASLLDGTAGELSAADLRRIRKLIDDAESQRK